MVANIVTQWPHSLAITPLAARPGSGARVSPAGPERSVRGHGVALTPARRDPGFLLSLTPEEGSANARQRVVALESRREPANRATWRRNVARHRRRGASGSRVRRPHLPRRPAPPG
jgi:hypothetical protein